MTITLARLPRNAKYEIRPVRESRVQRAATGGARLPLSRLGDHWEIEVDTGAMSPDCARSLIADVLRAAGEPVRVLIPHPMETGAPGSVRVAGGDQAGAVLDVDGATPYFVFKKGRFITVETAGAGRTYLVTEETVASAAGAASIPIWPMLGVLPDDNDPVEVAEPYIEGLVDGGGDSDTGLIAAVTPGSFVIEENA